MTRTRFRFTDDTAPHFMTDTIVAWLPLFSRLNLVEIVLDSWRYLIRERGVTIFGYVIMENHLHWIATAPNLPGLIRDFKSFTARKMVSSLTSDHATTLLQELEYFKLRHKVQSQFQVWQEGSHPQLIASEAIARQKLEYIHNNPVRRGYVDEPWHWRHSSARNYQGMPGELEVTLAW